MSGSRWWLAILVLLGAALVTYLPRPEAAIAPARLQEIASSMDGWNSEDLPIDPRMVAVASVDSFLNRAYRRDSGEELGLYVGYYRGQRAGDAVHSPKNCLPGAGWQPVRSARIALALPSDPSADVNLYIVENESQRYVVLYWYQARGAVIASEYRAKFQTLHDAIVLRRTDCALVRITVPITTSEAQSTQTAMNFAALIAPQLEQALPR